MVHYERYVQLKKGVVAAVVYEDVNENNKLLGSHNNGSTLGLLCGGSGVGGYYNYHYYFNISIKRTRPKLFYLLLLTLLSCTLIVAPQFCFLPTTFPLLYSTGAQDKGLISDASVSLCSSVSNGTICCERNSIRTDVCIMRGDVRTHSSSFSVLLYTPSNNTNDYITRVSDLSIHGKDELQHETIKPYTRKWEASTMATIDELHLISKKLSYGVHHQCDVKHDVPAVFFSTGGYTGNVYHEFNDGLLPLFITSQHFNRKVVFVILEYHDWWITKYADILSLLSDYPPIDYSGEKTVHCFREAIVGLKIHDELTVNSSLMEGNVSVRDFRNILDEAYRPRILDIIQEEEREAELLKDNFPSLQKLTNPISKKGKSRHVLKKPKLVIMSRNGSRSIMNEDLLVKMAEQIGFFVEVLKPNPTTELAKIYRSLNSSDVMIGVHGAAMTHFLFMRPGSVFIQVVPLGTNWAAETYYGEPAKKLGLRYIGYEIIPNESSLFEDYDKDDPVLSDPDSVNNKGWEFTKKIYLDRQKVQLDLVRFGKRLARAYSYFSGGKKRKHIRRSFQ